MGAGRRWVVSVVAVVASITVTACLSGDEFDPLVPPQTASTLPTSTTVAPDYSTVPLAAVGGTTTTVPVVVGPGPATLAGRVEGPDGPVAGAVVRAERLAGDEAASVDVVAGEDGSWAIAGVLGGRYRVRAWRQPDLAAVEPQLIFVDTRGADGVVVTVEGFAPLVVDTAVAPDPPIVGQRTSLRVRVATQEVDADGVVRSAPRPALPVALQPGTGWAVEPPQAALTDEAGGATFVMVCRLPGPQPLAVVLLPEASRPAPGADASADEEPERDETPGAGAVAGEVVPLTLPECQPPPPAEATDPADTTAPTGPVRPTSGSTTSTAP